METEPTVAAWARAWARVIGLSQALAKTKLAPAGARGPEPWAPEPAPLPSRLAAVPRQVPADSGEH